MNELLATIFDFIASQILANVTSVYFIVALILLFLGIFLLLVTLETKKHSYDAIGKILGVFTYTTQKINSDPDAESKIRFRLVFEYKNQQGRITTETGNSWSSNYLKKYTTGEEVDISVVPGQDNDGVYIKGDKTPYIFSFVFIFLGSGTLLFFSNHPVFIGLMVLFIIGFVVFFKIVFSKKAAFSGQSHAKLQLDEKNIIPLERLKK